MEYEPANEQDCARHGWIRVDVRGKTEAVWASLREKLIVAIGQVLDSITEEQDKGDWFKATSREFTSALLGHAKERLARAGLENAKIEAEVAEIYAKRERELAEARKVHADADAREFKTSLDRLRLMLGATKAMLIGEKGKEALLLGRQLKAFLEVVNELSQDVAAG
jgi:hypothetical protein